MLLITILFGVLVGADLVTTAIGLRLGGIELNPFGPSMALAVKALLTLVMLVLIQRSQARWRMMLVGVLALGWPVAWNLGQLLDIGRPT
jgi:hypothetical protein